MNVHPGDRGRPGRPKAGGECGAVRNADPPLYALQNPAGYVGLMIPVEIRHVDIDPCHRGRPGCPKTIDKGGPGGLSHPPLAGLQPAADDVSLPIIIEITHLDIGPSHGGTPISPQRPVVSRALVVYFYPPISASTPARGIPTP